MTTSMESNASDYWTFTAESVDGVARSINILLKNINYKCRACGLCLVAAPTLWIGTLNGDEHSYGLRRYQGMEKECIASAAIRELVSNSTPKCQQCSVVAEKYKKEGW